MAEKKDSSTSLCLKLLSWNICGLKKKYLEERTQAVCDFIKSRQPDCVFLQEVVSSNKDIISKQLDSLYDLHVSPNPPVHYYPAILVRKTAFSKVGSLEVYNFPKSGMGRHLLQLPVSFAGVEIDLITSHLESLSRASDERENQLLYTFMKMVEMQKVNKTSLFAGDLNVRNKEVNKIGVPKEVLDVWEACGSDEKHKFTWDTRKNDFFEEKQTITARYDRMYLSPSDGRVKPMLFELVGKEKIPIASCGQESFPSDHWGMWAEFEIV